MSVFDDGEFWYSVLMASKHDFTKPFRNQKFFVPMMIDDRHDAMLVYRLQQTATQPYNTRFVIPQKMVFEAEFREHSTWKPNPNRIYMTMDSKEITRSIRQKNLIIDKRSSIEEVEELLCIFKLMRV